MPGFLSPHFGPGNSQCEELSCVLLVARTPALNTLPASSTFSNCENQKCLWTLTNAFWRQMAPD